MRRDMNLPPEPSRRQAFFAACRSVVVRSALLFSTAGVALTLFLAPMMVREDRGFGVDTTVTGSIGSTETYTVRKSVLSQKRSGVCVIQSNNRQVGDC